MRWLIACVLLVFSSLSLAEGRAYGEIQVAASGVKHSELDFYPVLGSVSAGVFMMPGVGLEVFADTGLAADSVDGFELNLEQAYGIAARFQSQPVRGVQGYVVLGAVNYTIDQRAIAPASNGISAVNEDFTGMRVSLGLMQRLQRFPNMLFTMEYRHYNADDPLRVDALLLGLRVNAP